MLSFDAECLECAAPIESGRGKRGRVRLRCSKRCNKVADNRRVSIAKAVERDRNRPPCEGCGASMTGRDVRARFCSTLCNNIARGHQPPRRTPIICALDDCDVEFGPIHPRQRACSEAHGKKLWNRESRADGRQKAPEWSDKRRDAYHRRRALKKGASTGVPVVFSEIAARDEWLCQLCGGEVHADTPWPEPLSPSLDHVIPLKVGPQNPVAGTHDPSNVQLAHLRCNTAKGNRIAPLLLTG